MIQVLDKDGINNESWVWLGEAAGMEEGWYDIVTWEPIKHTIKPGQGFLMNVMNKVSLQVAGQVAEGATTIPLNAGFSVVGNCSPVPVDIQSIKLIDASGDSTEMIQVLDEEGINNESWVWLGEAAGMEDGWYDIVTWEPITETVNPGTAFLFNVVKPTSVNIPAAL